MLKFQFVKKSSNVKVGPIPVTNSPRATCPSACPLSGEGGCYAEAGFHTRLNWDKLDRGERGLVWSSFLDKIKDLPAGQLWRHNVSGDLPSVSDNELSESAVSELVSANRGKRGFTYTHYPMTRTNKRIVKTANDSGFTINVSCETVQDAVKHHKQGLPSVTLLPIDAPPKTEHDGVVVATCPATYMDTSCKECGLCARSDRKVVVGFPVHGTRKNAAASNLIAVG
jgi:hypothetical protein